MLEYGFCLVDMPFTCQLLDYSLVDADCKFHEYLCYYLVLRHKMHLVASVQLG